MKTKSLILALSLITASMLITPGAKSQTASYYLGDAVIYNGQIIIGSTNMGGNLELFKLEANQISRTGYINWVASALSSSNQFYGFTFSVEQGSLYAYLVDGRYLYKYDISNPSMPTLVSKVKDGNWDYFMGVERKDNNLLTFGVKGIKVWNLAGQVIASYNLNNKFSYNINYQTSDSIINVDLSDLKIFNKITGQVTKDVPIFFDQDHNRKTWVDQITGAIYLVDDQALKKFDYSGYLINSFKHISNRGYDVAGFQDQDHLYFTDGKGIVKFSKNNLEPLRWAYTTNLAESNGWAMGLKVLRDNSGEKIVIFNNSSILVLDQNLKLISHVTPANETVTTRPQENLFLSLDKNQAAAGSMITLRGGGYAAGEGLTISLAKQTYYATADAQGRFVKTITVPAVPPIKTDIKVTGNTSGRSYSINFEIE